MDRYSNEAARAQAPDPDDDTPCKVCEHGGPQPCARHPDDTPATTHRDVDGDGLTVELDRSRVILSMHFDRTVRTMEPALLLTPAVARAVAADLLAAADAIEGAAKVEDNPEREAATVDPHASECCGWLHPNADNPEREPAWCTADEGPR